jgi:hypothetical protein
MSETQRGRALRSALIGYGVLAFTFFPPTRTLMLWGVLQSEPSAASCSWRHESEEQQ